MSLRIRQIVFAAHALEPSVTQFVQGFGTHVVYRDPEVATFGLENALLTLGDQFVEVVAPTRAEAPAVRHLERHGDSAYMLILQTDDLARDRERLARLGVRIIWQSSHEDMSSVQLHPKDLGAAIVSLDQAVPAQSWRWAGSDWRRTSNDVIREVGIAARDPQRLAQRWAEVLGIEPAQHAGGWCIPIDEGVLRFHATTGAERISEYVVETTRNAELIICGTSFRLVERR
jgi:hypothetical protein